MKAKGAVSFLWLLGLWWSLVAESKPYVKKQKKQTTKKRGLRKQLRALKKENRQIREQIDREKATKNPRTPLPRPVLSPIANSSPSAGAAGAAGAAASPSAGAAGAAASPPAGAAGAAASPPAGAAGAAASPPPAQYPPVAAAASQADWGSHQATTQSGAPAADAERKNQVLAAEYKRYRQFHDAIQAQRTGGADRAPSPVPETSVADTRWDSPTRKTRSKSRERSRNRSEISRSRSQSPRRSKSRSRWANDAKAPEAPLSFFNSAQYGMLGTPESNAMGWGNNGLLGYGGGYANVYGGDFGRLGALGAPGFSPYSAGWLGKGVGLATFAAAGEPATPDLPLIKPGRRKRPRQLNSTTIPPEKKKKHASSVLTDIGADDVLDNGVPVIPTTPASHESSRERRDREDKERRDREDKERREKLDEEERIRQQRLDDEDEERRKKRKDEEKAHKKRLEELEADLAKLKDTKDPTVTPETTAPPYAPSVQSNDARAEDMLPPTARVVHQKPLTQGSAAPSVDLSIDGTPHDAVSAQESDVGLGADGGEYDDKTMRRQDGYVD